jgi:hypothetical protein
MCRIVNRCIDAKKAMRRRCVTVILLAAFTFAGSAQLSAQASPPGTWQTFLIPQGKTVYDIVNRVTWLADMNLAHKPEFPFGFALCDDSSTGPVPCIWAEGSMDYNSAQLWVTALNNYDNGKGYLGHQHWQLPTTPLNATDCSERGRPPTFRELGFPKFTVQDAEIRFIVADTEYADNSGDFVLTIQTPSPND